MEAKASAAFASDIAISDMGECLEEGTLISSSANELQNALGVSSEVDTALAYTSEKLANIENLLLCILAGESDIEPRDVENDDISAVSIEKALTIDLLYAELRELDNLLSDLQDQNVHALHKISTCEHLTEVLVGLASKLHESEELLKQSQERVWEMKLQLAKLKLAEFTDVKEDHCLAEEWKPEIRALEERRTLRMLEKSLARELEQEKKLTEHKQNEEDLKLKMHLTEQVAVFMEEAAEVAWSRFLEADNTAEVLMGISKEMLKKLQMGHSNLCSSTNREEEINCKLQGCINQLNAKEASIFTLSGRIAKLMTDNTEVSSLREKVQMLEEKPMVTESRLEEADALNETSQQQLKEIECEMETLRDKLYVTERRAESAEEKILHLTNSNLELTEELEGSNNSNGRRASELEKQLRELDIQLQHARASSEASQEQQNMLYSAIWDMETLIDELKQKVAQSDNKVETAEMRCTNLSETNSKMKKELEFLRSRVEFMEGSFNQATLEKKLCAEGISIRTSLIMDMVMQLSLERERIQSQLISVTRENKLLRETLQKDQKLASVIFKNNRSSDEKECLLSRLNSVDSGFANTSAGNTNEITSVERPWGYASSPDEHQTELTSPMHHAMNAVQQPETNQWLNTTGKCLKTSMFMAVLAVMLSILAAHLFQENLPIINS